MSGHILQLLDDPEALEALYQQDPEAFCRSLQDALQANPDSPVLRVWHARLSYGRPNLGAGWRSKLAYTIAIALVLGAAIRLPAIWLGTEWYYPRFAPLLVILALGSYFWMERRRSDRLIAGLGLAAISITYVCLLPGLTDSVVMALIHLPIVFWVFLGFVFMGDAWRKTEARTRFVRYSGELLVLASLLALGGIVFSGVTIALFELISDNIENRYFENVAIFGAAAIPIVGTYLYDAVFSRRTGTAMVLARVFAPLFLAMAVTYLIVAFVGGQNPFIDLSFLITFNGLLLIVLGITVFSILERGNEAAVGVVDQINLGLVVVTLLMDTLALTAILFRLASFGFSPNRVVVLGVNLIIMVHLAWICRTYIGLVRQRSGFAEMRRVVGSYLPVYGIWAAIVAFLLPLVFGFA